MKKEKKTSILKRLSLIEAALLVGSCTLVAGTPFTTSARQISKTIPVKPKSTKETIQNETISSKKQFEEMIVEKEESSEVEKQSNQIEEQSTSEEPTFDSNFITSSEELYFDTMEEEQNQEAPVTLELEDQEFNCPKDETEEERDARLKAKEEQYQNEIKEEATRYQEYLKGFYEPLLKTYAKYYHLDGNKVIAIAKKLTKDYTIDLAKFTNTTDDAIGTVESKVMLFVSQLSDDDLTVKLKSLGYSKSSLSTNQKIETIKPNLILSNGQSYSQFMEKVCTMMGIDKVTALAISFHESGRVTSYLARNKNNFGGLIGSSFPTPEAGIIEYVRFLKWCERTMKQKLGPSTLVNHSRLYVNGNPSGYPNYEWVNLVSSFIREITRDKKKYFPPFKINLVGNSYRMLSIEKTFGESEKVYTKTIN